MLKYIIIITLLFWVSSFAATTNALVSNHKPSSYKFLPHLITNIGVFSQYSSYDSVGGQLQVNAGYTGNRWFVASLNDMSISQNSTGYNFGIKTGAFVTQNILLSVYGFYNMKTLSYHLYSLEKTGLFQRATLGTVLRYKSWKWNINYYQGLTTNPTLQTKQGYKEGGVIVYPKKEFNGSNHYVSDTWVGYLIKNWNTEFAGGALYQKNDAYGLQVGSIYHYALSKSFNLSFSARSSYTTKKEFVGYVSIGLLYNTTHVYILDTPMMQSMYISGTSKDIKIPIPGYDGNNNDGNGNGGNNNGNGGGGNGNGGGGGPTPPPGPPYNPDPKTDPDVRHDIHDPKHHGPIIINHDINLDRELVIPDGRHLCGSTCTAIVHGKPVSYFTSKKFFEASQSGVTLNKPMLYNRNGNVMILQGSAIIEGFALATNGKYGIHNDGKHLANNYPSIVIKNNHFVNSTLHIETEFTPGMGANASLTLVNNEFEFHKMPDGNSYIELILYQDNPLSITSDKNTLKFGTILQVTKPLLWIHEFEGTGLSTSGSSGYIWDSISGGDLSTLSYLAKITSATDNWSWTSISLIKNITLPSPIPLFSIESPNLTNSNALDIKFGTITIQSASYGSAHPFFIDNGLLLKNKSNINLTIDTLKLPQVMNHDAVNHTGSLLYFENNNATVTNTSLHIKTLDYTSSTKLEDVTSLLILTNANIEVDNIIIPTTVPSRGLLSKDGAVLSDPLIQIEESGNKYNAYAHLQTIKWPKVRIKPDTNNINASLIKINSQSVHNQYSGIGYQIGTIPIQIISTNNVTFTKSLIDLDKSIGIFGSAGFQFDVINNADVSQAVDININKDVVDGTKIVWSNKTPYDAMFSFTLSEWGLLKTGRTDSNVNKIHVSGHLFNMVPMDHPNQYERNTTIGSTNYYFNDAKGDYSQTVIDGAVFKWSDATYHPKGLKLYNDNKITSVDAKHAFKSIGSFIDAPNIPSIQLSGKLPKYYINLHDNQTTLINFQGSTLKIPDNTGLFYLNLILPNDVKMLADNPLINFSNTKFEAVIQKKYQPEIFIVDITSKGYTLDLNGGSVFQIGTGTDFKENTLLLLELNDHDPTGTGHTFTLSNGAVLGAEAGTSPYFSGIIDLSFELKQPTDLDTIVSLENTIMFGDSFLQIAVAHSLLHLEKLHTILKVGMGFMGTSQSQIVTGNITTKKFASYAEGAILDLYYLTEGNVTIGNISLENPNTRLDYYITTHPIVLPYYLVASRFELGEIKGLRAPAGSALIDLPREINSNSVLYIHGDENQEIYAHHLLSKDLSGTTIDEGPKSISGGILILPTLSQDSLTDSIFLPVVKSSTDNGSKGLLIIQKVTTFPGATVAYLKSKTDGTLAGRLWIQHVDTVSRGTLGAGGTVLNSQSLGKDAFLYLGTYENEENTIVLSNMENLLGTVSVNTFSAYIVSPDNTTKILNINGVEHTNQFWTLIHIDEFGSLGKCTNFTQSNCVPLTPFVP